MKLHNAYLAGLIDAGGYLQRRERGKWIAWQFRLTAPTMEIAQTIATHYDGKVEEIGGGYRVAWYSREGIAGVLEAALPHLIKLREEVSAFVDEK